MSKFDFINWPRSIEIFNHQDQNSLKPTSLVIVNCLDCKVEMQKTFRSVDAKNTQPYTPLCRSCRQKRHWTKPEYRTKHGEKQSIAMKKVWQDQAYRDNNSAKHIEVSKKLWEDDEYRSRVTNGIKQKYADDPEYRAKSAATLRSDKAIAARRNALGPLSQEHRNKIAASCRLKWQDQEFRSKVIASLQALADSGILSENAKKLWADPAYRAKLEAYHIAAKTKQSEYAKKKWADPEFRSRMLAVARSDKVRQARSAAVRKALANPEVRRKLSTKSKANWNNPAYRRKIIPALTRAANDPERRKRLSELSKSRWKQPGYKEKVSKAMQKTMNSPEMIEKLSARSKECWNRKHYRDKLKARFSTEEFRRSASERSKRLWNDPEFVAKQNLGKSRLEEILADTLDSIGIEYIRQYQLGSWPYDFMIPHSPKNIVIEVNGDYFHSQPKAITRDAAKATFLHEYFGDDHELHVIWEHEFSTVGKPIALLKKWLGLEDNPITQIDFDFSDVEVKLCDTKEANWLFSKYHYAASGGRGGFNYGAILNGQLIACARFCGPTRSQSASRLGFKQHEMLELTRFVIHPAYQKKNFASWMLARCIKIIESSLKRVKCLISFADETQGHIGTIYKAANWIHDGIVPPDYFYLSQDNWPMHKRTLWTHASKNRMTESAYAEKHGYQKMWGKQKHRYVYYLA